MKAIIKNTITHLHRIVSLGASLFQQCFDSQKLLVARIKLLLGLGIDLGEKKRRRGKSRRRGRGGRIKVVSGWERSGRLNGEGVDKREAFVLIPSAWLQLRPHAVLGDDFR